MTSWGLGSLAHVFSGHLLPRMNPWLFLLSDFYHPSPRGRLYGCSEDIHLRYESQCPSGYLEECSLAGQTLPCQRRRGGRRKGERQRMWLFRNRKGLKKNHDNQKNVLLCLSFSVCTRLHKSHSQLCGREWWSLIPFRRQKQSLVNNEALGSSYSRRLGTLWVTLLSSECVLHLFQKHWVSCSIIYNQNNSS